MPLCLFSLPFSHLITIPQPKEVKVSQSCPTLCDPMDYTVHGSLQARILEWEAFPFSRGSSKPGIEPRSPALQADSLQAEPPGKPQNTGVGSLSLLQRIFPTQESNQGLLHCRWILYLSVENNGSTRTLSNLEKKIPKPQISMKSSALLPLKGSAWGFKK